MVDEKLVKSRSDEIDLREYINVIIKRKRMILGIFLISLVITAIFSLMQPKIYEAFALIMITPSRLQNTLSPTQISLEAEKNIDTGTYIGQRPTISLPTHVELLKSSAVLERVIYRLKLIDEQGKYLTSVSLLGKLTIKETKETNILRLAAEDRKPAMAKEMANVWAQEYIAYSQELISGEVKGTGEFINNQFSIVQQNLFQSETKIKDFKDKYKLDLMRAELDMKKSKLNEYKKELMDIEVSLQTKQDSLRQLKKAIAKQDKFVIVSKAITDDALWQETMRQKSASTLNKKKLSSEQLNPIYQDLETRIVNAEIEINTLTPRIEYLHKSVSLNELEIDELEKTINQREFELTQLNRQVDLYKNTYNSLSAKMEEARITKAAQLGEIKLVSSALEPGLPIKPNRRLIVAIAGFVSLICGIFLAFFMEYWSKPKQDRN